MSDFAQLRWLQLQQHHKDLSVYGVTMRDAGATQIDRDIATRRYICAIDCLIAELNELHALGEMGEISEFLEARGRRLS